MSGEGRALPLAGKGIAVTRPEPAGGPLERRLTRLGARVLRWNAVEIHPPADPTSLAEAVAHLDRYDWLVLASAHAVAALAALATQPSASRPRVAAVGPSTAEAAEDAGLRVDRIPAETSAAGLVEAFRAAGDASGARVLLPGSSFARPELADGLKALGAEVTFVEAYRTLPAQLDTEACRAALAKREVDAITFTSPSAVEGFAAALGAEGLAAVLRGCRVISIGPTTSQALAARSRPPNAEARPSTLDGVVDALIAQYFPRFEGSDPG